MSLSELARRLNLPASRMRKAVADRVVRPCGEIGHNIIVALLAACSARQPTNFLLGNAPDTW